MSRAAKAVTYTLNGTTSDDVIALVGGQLTLNGTGHSIPAGATHVTLNGGDGNDTIVTDSPFGAASQPVSYDGGAGTDTLDLSHVDEAVWVRLVNNAKAHGATASYVTVPSMATEFTVDYLNVNGGDANDPNAVVSSASDLHTNIANFESVVGTAYNDYLELGNVAGTADGGDGNDRVIGGAQGDHLLGGAGDDFLFGKAGNDVMTGGTGADQFELVSGTGDEVITDFNASDGDSLFIGWQSSTDVLPDASSWHTTTWTDSSGSSHQAITATLTAGSVTLVDLTLADVSTVVAHTTEFHFLNG